jgi:hypothetical protein
VWVSRGHDGDDDQWVNCDDNDDHDENETDAIEMTTMKLTGLEESDKYKSNDTRYQCQGHDGYGLPCSSSI